MNTKEFTIGHHSDIAHDGRPQFDRVNSYHKSLGFPISSLGHWCGYHLFIEEDGTLIEARAIGDRGAHTVNCGCKTDLTGSKFNTLNWRAIGICLAGRLTVQQPKQAQIKTLHDVTWHLSQTYGSRFFLHWETKATSCPGTDLRALVEKEHVNWLKKDLSNKVNALRWAEGSRRTLLERTVTRLMRKLESNS